MHDLSNLILFNHLRTNLELCSQRLLTLELCDLRMSVGMLGYSALGYSDTGETKDVPQTPLSCCP